MLFGHQNDDTNDTNQPAPAVDDTIQPSAAPALNPLAVDPDTGISLPTAPEELEQQGNTAPDAPVLDQPHYEPADLPSSPAHDDAGSLDTLQDSDLHTPSGSDDLLALKQQALSELSPLVDHLEQSPEEKFRTTMMMIQSSDNQALIKDAYAAAQQIKDDKVRAQALLDIVNEINYFTQHTDS